MIETKILGRITSAKFGWGGYQDTMIGLFVKLEGDSLQVGDFHGISPDGKNEDFALRQAALGGTCLFVGSVLTLARVKSVDQLVGIPVEMTFMGNALMSWRVLTEVLG